MEKRRSKSWDDRQLGRSFLLNLLELFQDSSSGLEMIIFYKKE